MTSDLMACPTALQDETVERYLVGDLDPSDRDAFEAHLFECDRCLDHIRMLGAVRSELAAQRSTIIREASRRRWLAPLAAVAAAAIVAVGVTLARRPEPPPQTTQTTQSVAQPPGAPTPRGPSPDLILALSKVDPPPYVAMTVRGDASAPSDFDRGMTAYAKQDFRRAEGLLAKASASEPDAATNFFLGISRLMIEDPSGAAVALRRCIALGSSPYVQAARVALAKALLRTNDLTEAERALADATLLPGDEATEAKLLLERLQKGRAATP
jgi:anti-sigma factor RsiW